jgi:hypothetical protein
MCVCGGGDLQGVVASSVLVLVQYFMKICQFI